MGDALLELERMPGAVQNLPENEDEAIRSGITLDVRQCSFCSLVQLTNDAVPYYKDVIRAGGFSPSMKSRQKHEFRKFIEKFSLQGKNILEIGSGRGEYLSILEELSVKAIGIENNQGFVETSRNNGLNVFQGYPTDQIDELDSCKFDGLVSITFLEHAPNPGTFLRASASRLLSSGVGMISVPDFEYELEDNYLFSFMSDHLSYFSAESLSNALNLNGLKVLEVFRNKELNVVTAYFKKRDNVNLSKPLQRFELFNRDINSYLESVTEGGRRVAIWGASHLAFSIIAASGSGEKISFIVDSAPFKQHKYTPASGLIIVPPEHLIKEPVETVIVMSPEYSDEIVGSIKKNYSNVVTNIATFIDGGLRVIQ